MKLTKYTKLGLLIVLSFAIFIWGMNYLKGIDFFKQNTTYNVVYERVDGLLESSAVMMNGYQVGQVKSIDFSDKNDGSLLVAFSMEGDFKIPRGSAARIISSDIMGTKSIKLQIVPSNAYYQPGDTIPGSIEEDLKEQVSMQVLPLKNKAEQLLGSLDSAITVITYVFNAEARKNLSESFSRINQTILNLETASNEISELLVSEKSNLKGIIQNMNELSASLNNNSDDFTNIVSNFSSISDSLAAADLANLIEQLNTSAEGMSSILSKIDTGTGTAGKLLNDEALYSNLADMSQSLDNLLKDFRNNPKRYVHFSAFDLGKNVFVSPQSAKVENRDSGYNLKVHLVSSPTRLSLQNSIFESFNQMEEVEISGVYSYLTGNTSDIDEIMEIHSKAKIIFPDASIVAFKNGRKVRLEKALKKLGN
ncbi:MlaD family protein [Sunxiuqinia sp. sy24]|uniref:MlaD family protein n=1 Tax=Sunxiuqinia sp. sy24 TaxID=3461495 RepID=UPI0040460F18